jgi:tight adherence protein C
MPITVWLSALAVVAATGLLVWAFSGSTTAVDADVRRNLRVPAMDLRTDRLGVPFVDRTLGRMLDRLASAGRSLQPAERADRCDRLIARAGMTGRWAAEQHFALKVLTTGVVAVLGSIRLLVGPSMATLAVVALVVAAAWMLPDLYLRNRAAQRQQQIVQELPDVLDQVTISVEAGLGFEAALLRVVQTTPGPLSEEFGRMLQDVQVGARRTDALEQMVERTDAADLRHVATALVQADRHGIALAHTLRVQSKELRQKRRMRAQEAANKVAVKLLFPVVFCLFPALFVVILGPAVIRIADAF